MDTRDDTAEDDIAAGQPALEVAPALSVLVVEDDLLTREILRLALEDAGFAVHVAGSLAAMQTVLACEPLDLVILNLSLPDGNALDALANWPAGERPAVICTSSNADPHLRVAVLDAGADDFILKPVHEIELAARAKGVLRRNRPPQDQAKVINCGGWSMDAAAGRCLGPDGRPVRLTSAEERLLVAFLRNRGRPLTRSWLSMAVFKREWRVDDRSVDVIVGRLRRKLAERGGLAISAVRYVGYRLDVEAGS